LALRDFLTAEMTTRIIFGASASGSVGKSKIAWGLSQAILVGCELDWWVFGMV